MLKNIIFDFDGTLIDTKEGIANGINYVFRKINLSPPSRKKIISAIGPPLEKILSTILDTDDALVLNNAVKIYRTKYREIYLKESTPYYGVSDLIKYLFQQKLKLYIVTNKPRIYANRLLNNYRIKKYFNRIIGRSLYRDNLSKIDMIKKLLIITKLKPSETIMVGDRREDSSAAKANRIRFIGVSYGYGSIDELKGENPIDIGKNSKQLKRIIQNLL